MTELPDSIGSLGSVSESPELPALPVTQSDAIIIGTITESQPYMTESQHVIYTEFTFQVEDVLKGKELGNITGGNLIKVDREAGAIRLTNGKKVYYDAAGTGNAPRAKKRYLLFLKRINDRQDLSIINGYKLLNGKVFPLTITKIFSLIQARQKQ